MGGGNFYNYLTSFAAGMGGLLFGYEIGVIGQVLVMNSFNADFDTGTYNATTDSLDRNSDQTNRYALVATMFLFGCIIGAGIFSMVSDMLGRKRSILVGGTLFGIGGLLQAAAGSYIVLMIGRFVSGLAIGTVSLVVPMYISETAPANIRGTLTTIYQLMITLGIFIATVINTILLKTMDVNTSAIWRVALGMQLVPSTILIILVFFIPYSPRWLAEKGRHDEGQQAIAKLRSLDYSDSAVVTEYDEIRRGVEFEQNIGEASWSEILKPGIRWRVTIAIINQLFQQFTGINVLLYYSGQIFANLGLNADFSKTVFPLLNTFINFIATFPGMWLVERVGRRPLLIFGGFGMGASHLLIFTFFSLSQSAAKAYAWGAIVAIYMFTICFAVGWGPVVWTYQAEIFPLRIRAKGTGLGTMANWIGNTIIAYGFPVVDEALNHQPSFYFIFASTSIAMGIWAYFAISETKGKTLEEIDAVFGDNLAVAEIEAQQAGIVFNKAVGGH